MKENRMFRVVECRGTQYEIGRQYGEACKKTIICSIERNLESVAWLSVSKGDLIANAMKFLPLVKKFDPELMDFLKGEADGAGITFEEAFTLRCWFELAFYYKKVVGLCTSFAVTGEAAQGGKTILGQNLDWFADFPIDLLKIEHNNGLKQLSLSFGGIVECTMNSYGLGMCANMTMAPEIENFHKNIPFGCYMPKVMRQKIIGDALGILCKTARGIQYFALGSAEGDIIGIESVFDDFNILYPEKDMLFHCNHYLTERFKKGDRCYLSTPDSYLRIYRIRRLMEKHYGKITPKIIMEVLTDHNNYPNSICRHANPNVVPHLRSETTASYIMVPEEEKMYISYGPPCQYEYIEYKL
jgi:isopenicillin-N N-acyltransferase-like protein